MKHTSSEVFKTGQEVKVVKGLNSGDIAEISYVGRNKLKLYVYGEADYLYMGRKVKRIIKSFEEFKHNVEKIKA